MAYIKGVCYKCSFCYKWNRNKLEALKSIEELKSFKEYKINYFL